VAAVGGSSRKRQAEVGVSAGRRVAAVGGSSRKRQAEVGGEAVPAA
jgi:hypothetical protein